MKYPSCQEYIISCAIIMEMDIMYELQMNIYFAAMQQNSLQR